MKCRTRVQERMGNLLKQQTVYAVSQPMACHSSSRRCVQTRQPCYRILRLAERRPVALRRRLSTGLPFSSVLVYYIGGAVTNFSAHCRES